MTVPFRLVIVLVGAVSTAGISGSNAQNGAATRKAASAQLPANYRLLMAQYLRVHNPYPVVDAKITAPYEKWGGLLGGSNFSAVCIAIFRNNPFGIVVRDNWVLTIENGRVKESSLGTGQCTPLFPFNELKTR